MMRQLWLPKGVDDSGGIQIPGGNANRDISIWVTLRDHANLDFYYLVANTPAWKRISLGTVNWSQMGGIKYAPMLPGRWWTDVAPLAVTADQLSALLNGTGGLAALENNNPATVAQLKSVKTLMASTTAKAEVQVCCNPR